MIRFQFRRYFSTTTMNKFERINHIPRVIRKCGLHIDEALPITFNKILIANRGEISCRVIRTCKQLNIDTVAVYSDADEHSQHVKLATEAYRVGKAPANESYLLSDKILEIAHKTGAQAIHPGYGFLSENAIFAKQCADANITFIGPPVDAIEAMGSKSASKSIMLNSNVPCVPGYHGEDQSIERLRNEAEKIGFPLMIKAVLGGGGKGMRIVENSNDFDEMLDACKRESLKSFKDDRVLLERYIQNPRHIEFQIFGDHNGNAVHFFERDCSVQRRHQKVLEESPAPGMSRELRNKMGQSAVDAAKAVGYVGAGTVEFIVDADTDEYFFMEMNTRLQVEHPVSEMVSGRDFVQLQLHVAAGHELPCTQENANTLGTNGNDPFGHALEARIYAENPANNFLPATGTLRHLIPPNQHENSSLDDTNIRVESGVVTGDEVSIYYDPMIAKLILWAPDRLSCLRAMSNALNNYEIIGLPTNIAFLKRCVDHQQFQDGGVTTNFIGDNYDALLPIQTFIDPHLISAAAIFLYQSRHMNSEYNAINSSEPNSPWHHVDDFRVNSPRITTLEFKDKDDDVNINIQLTRELGDLISIKIVQKHGDAEPLIQELVTRAEVQAEDESEGTILLRDEVKLRRIKVVQGDNAVHVFNNGEQFTFQLPITDFGAHATDHGSISPMSGRIVKTSVKTGDKVKKGAALMVMEAMKMEHVIRAPADGVVAKVLYGENDFVEGGKILVTFED